MYDPSSMPLPVPAGNTVVDGASAACANPIAWTNTIQTNGRRRIVHISLGTDVGGMEKLLVEFARWTDPSQYDLHFISLQSSGEAAKQIHALGLPVIALGKPSGFRPDVVVALSRQLRRMAPDVVHTHNTAGFLYGVAASTLARVPMVIHTRHGQRFEAPKRQTLSFRWLSRWVDHVVSVSNDGQQLTIKEGISAERTCTIRNGIDLNQFPYVGPTANGPAVLVARLSAEKDVACLIRAIAIAHQKRRDQEATISLRIVGDGAERPGLESLTRELGLCKSIEFLGQRRNIREALRGASMFVLPSLSEGISLTLLEAMACGLPVIATHVGGNPEVVVPDLTGMLVPARDPEAIADAMLELWRDETMATRYGLEGRQRVELEFGIQRMIHEYELLYQTGDSAS
ncbi:MAG: glycosyltransferase [Planctomycetota bacterium]